MEKTPKPLLVKNWSKSVRTRRAKKSKKPLVLRLNEVALPKEYRSNVKLDIDKRSGTVQILVRTQDVGQHFFPANIKTVRVASRRKLNEEIPLSSDGFLPDHLALSSYPSRLPKELRVRQRFDTSKRKADEGNLSSPTSIFGADDRFIFSDTAFPWCTCGKVETEAGWGSGVMIGPRHFMTASHVIVWKPNNTAGWMKFTPVKFDNSEPFGHAFATTIYSWNKNDGSDGLDLTEGAFDYVVCTLDSPLGNTTGWMGARSYDTSWDKGAYWSHIGYPRDLAGGTRPAFIGSQPFLGEQSATLNGRSSFRINHEIDVIPGQSGGPYFGWWDKEAWPRVVGIQSGQFLGGPRGDNTSAGGSPLSELVSFARNVAP